MCLYVPEILLLFLLHETISFTWISLGQFHSILLLNLTEQDALVRTAEILSFKIELNGTIEYAVWVLKAKIFFVIQMYVSNLLQMWGLPKCSK